MISTSARQTDRAVSLSPFVQGSVWLHGAAAVTALALPSAWPWCLGAVMLDHAALTTAGLWPRSRWLGSNWIGLPGAARARGEVALTLDDGPDPVVTPAALDLLDAHGAKATFFCIGSKVERYRELASEIVRRGHDIENHTQRHSHDFAFSGMAGFTREITAGQEAIGAVTGRIPEFFRAPAGLRNPFLQPVLVRLNLQLAAWTRRGFDTVSTDAGKVTQRLTAGLAAGDILLLHDGNAARTPQGVPVIQAVLPALLEAVRALGLRTVTLREARQ